MASPPLVGVRGMKRGRKNRLSLPGEEALQILCACLVLNQNGDRGGKRREEKRCSDSEKGILYSL
jgi:hypothetical protein